MAALHLAPHQPHRRMTHHGSGQYRDHVLIAGKTWRELQVPIVPKPYPGQSSSIRAEDAEQRHGDKPEARPALPVLREKQT